MLKRWARIALCTLAVGITGWAGAAPAGSTRPVAAAVAAAVSASRDGGTPPLTLSSQTPTVTPAAPWFTVALGVAAKSTPIGDLHVSLTFYSRLGDASQLQQAIGATPDKSELTRVSIPVTDTPLGRVAVACVTVLPDEAATPPVPAAGVTGACTPGAPTVVLGCTPDTGVCGDVYPVSVALLRHGDATPLSRFTTFMTYQEPGGIGSGGPLRVSVIMPVTSVMGLRLAPPSAADRRRSEQLAAELSANRTVPLTLSVNPRQAADLLAHGGRAGQRTLGQLADLASAPGVDQVLAQPFVPVNLAALTGAGLTAEITAQLDRGDAILRSAGLHPSGGGGGGSWVDTASTFSTADGANLASGLQGVHDSHLVLSDANLSPGGSEELTFAQPFTLNLGHGGHVSAAAANSQIDARFTADPGDPVLAANQVLASLDFIHFEDAFTLDPRGVVLEPPPSWQPQAAFVATLLTGMTNNAALSPVTLNQLFSQVPEGGNDEPVSRHLQSGPVPASQLVGAAMAGRINTARVHLSSFSGAVSGHPATLGVLSDALLATEYQGFTPAQRSVAMGTYTQQFTDLLRQISVAAERTITFTSRTAPIPITVLSTAPYTVTVVMTLDSDKFDFPDGNTRTLVLSRPTTPERIQAQARTSGDRLPVEVTLRTPDGQLTIAQAQLSVHSTSISIVGIALTVLAGLTLLIWWFRTWRKGRRHRPRAH